MKTPLISTANLFAHLKRNAYLVFLLALTFCIMIFNASFTKAFAFQNASSASYQEKNVQDTIEASQEEIVTYLKAITGPQKQKLIKDVEQYLQNLATARSRFVQTAHDGSQFVGTFHLERPGKMRFEYDPPIEDFVVADGYFIYFYDSELQEQSNAPIGQTLADFFLRSDVSLTQGDITVSEVKRGGDFLQMKLVQKDDPDAGSLTLAFEENPLNIKKWRVVDPQSLITEVELFYLQTGVTHPGGLFAYIDPMKGTAHYNE